MAHTNCTFSTTFAEEYIRNETSKITIENEERERNDECENRESEPNIDI